MKTVFKIVSFLAGAGFALGGCSMLSNDGGPAAVMIGMGVVLLYGTFKI